MQNIICALVVGIFIFGAGNAEYIKLNEVNNTPATWDEFDCDEYLKVALSEKNLDEGELRSLKHMGYSKGEIQKMSEKEARQYLYDWKISAEKYNDAITMQYFEADISQWKDISISENFVWSDGKSTINAHLIDEFISDIKNGYASIVIMYKDVICDVNYVENEGIIITTYKFDGSKQETVCDNILVNEDGYVFEGCDIVIP